MFQPVKRYIATEDLYLSHENRLVPAGEEFETAFSKAFKPSGNIREVKKISAEKKAGE